jgi:hypothetical protein
MANSETFIRALIRRLLLPAGAALGLASVGLGQTALVSNSPFAPSGSAGSGATGTPEAYELAGSSVVGSEVSVCIFERQAKHTEWIPVGGISNGVHVISYDVAHDRAVVSIGGARRELTLRKAAIAALSPSAATSMAVAAAPEAPAAPQATVGSAATAPSADPAREQTEARMLVSDLLEIGVQQRKAYQEAKQKAATGTPAQPSN